MATNFDEEGNETEGDDNATEGDALRTQADVMAVYARAVRGLREAPPEALPEQIEVIARNLDMVCQQLRDQATLLDRQQIDLLRGRRR